MHNINELKIWHKALNLADMIYTVTEKFPDTERYGIISQMRRASVSIGSNIAEGAGRNSQKEFNHFLGISNGSAYELRFQLELSLRRNFIDAGNHNLIAEEIDHLIRMNVNFQNRLRSAVDRNNRSTPDGNQ